MRRCSVCLLSEQAPGIAFDRNGVCSYCRQGRPFRPAGEGPLLEMLEAARGRGGRFDCLVPVSGGRDSAYALLKVVRDYGLRALAVNYRNPFTDPLALRNIRRMVDRLGVPLETFALPPGRHQGTLRLLLMAWLRHRSPALVPVICSACHTMWWPILRIAKRHRIPCIVTGRNPYEETSFKRVMLGVAADEDVRNVYLKNLKGILGRVLGNLSYLNIDCLPTLAIGHLFGSPFALGSRMMARGIASIDLFFHVPWDEKQVLARIERELGWRRPGAGDTWRYDCLVSRLRDAMYLSTLGMTEHDDMLSRMVRDGLITRKEALRRLDEENRVDRGTVARVLGRVGLGHMLNELAGPAP